MNGVFVTGTDTDVGKTVVSTLLCLRWNAYYWKPVQCGVEPATDRATLAKVIGQERTCPEQFLLKNPLSPNQAAEIEGLKIDLDDFHPPHVSPLVVEGAGGVLVPLNERQTMLDLAARLALPAVVVARSGLGTLNHTLLTLQALRERKIPVLGVVMVGDPHPRNRKSLEDIGRARILLELPKVPEITASWLNRMSDLLPPLEEVLWK